MVVCFALDYMLTYFFCIFKKSVTSTPIKFTPAGDMMDFMADFKSEVSQHICM